jgi:chromosome segregation ATPase
LRDQLTRVQNELTSSNNRRQSLETELLAARSELRDHKQRSRDYNSQLSDLQRQLQDSNENKNRVENRLLDLEKVRNIFNFNHIHFLDSRQSTHYRSRPEATT